MRCFLAATLMAFFPWRDAEAATATGSFNLKYAV